MSSSVKIGGPSAQADSAEQRICFVGHSNEAPWRADILSACSEVLPKFGLEPWYTADHYELTKTLRDKVVEAIANARYGIYDLSSWQDAKGAWHLPRNVLIELGIAIVYNRPTLLLRHTSNSTLPLPTCLQGLDIIEFAGETTLKRELEKRLPQWIGASPERDWLNRFCIFGNRICRFREQHPRSQSWDEVSLRGCHIADGIGKSTLGDRNVECDEIHAAFDDVLTRYGSLPFRYLDEARLPEGFQFRICCYCQTVRSTAFGIYRLFPHGSVDDYVSVGISIAVGAFFDYEIPRVLVVQREEDLPSLLRGYEVIEARSSNDLKRGLKARLPVVMQKLHETQWVPRPLPFVEPQSASLPLEVATEAPEARPISWVRCMQTAQAKIADITQRHEPALCVRREIQEQLLQYLASPRRRLAVVIGEPGIGKTHLLEHTALTLNRESPNQSVVAFCTGVELARKSVEDVLAETIGGSGSTAIRLAALDVQRREQDSDWRFVLMVDAINEHPDMFGLLQELVQIWAETAGYPWFSLLLSCRSSIWDKLAEQVVFGKIADEAQLTRFLVEKFSPSEGHEAYELFQSRYLIRTKYSDLPRQVREFIEVPVSLKLLCSTYQGQEIPLDLVLDELGANSDLRVPVVPDLASITPDFVIPKEANQWMVIPKNLGKAVDFVVRLSGDEIEGVHAGDSAFVHVQTSVDSTDLALVLIVPDSGAPGVLLRYVSLQEAGWHLIAHQEREPRIVVYPARNTTPDLESVDTSSRDSTRVVFGKLEVIGKVVGMSRGHSGEVQEIPFPHPRQASELPQRRGTRDGERRIDYSAERPEVTETRSHVESDSAMNASQGENDPNYEPPDLVLRSLRTSLGLSRKEFVRIHAKDWSVDIVQDLEDGRTRFRTEHLLYLVQTGLVHTESMWYTRFQKALGE